MGRFDCGGAFIHSLFYAGLLKILLYFLIKIMYTDNTDIGQEGAAVVFHYDDALTAFMREKKLDTIAVEVVTANSDIDCTELYIHLVKRGQAEELIKRKRYRAVSTEHGTVLLPPYVLEYAPEIRFWLKKTWIFRSVGYEGIAL